MAVYTIVFTFRGVPLTRQVKATSQGAALALWAKQVDLPPKQTPSVSLAEAVERETLVAIPGMTNVWTTMLYLGSRDGKTEYGVVVVTVTQVDAVYPGGNSEGAVTVASYGDD